MLFRSDVPARLAGGALRSWLPHGYATPGEMLAALGFHTFAHPGAAVGYLASRSPRLAGRIDYGTGALARRVGPVARVAGSLPVEQAALMESRRADGASGDLNLGTDPDERARRIEKRLSGDLDLAPHQAAGIVSNLKAESGLRGINEIRPAIPGSRGGFGWAQWTGPRRVAMERWASARGLDPASDEANYGFLVHELRTEHGALLERLRRAQDAETAAHVFFPYESGNDPGLERHRPGHVAYARNWRPRENRMAAEGGRVDGVSTPPRGKFDHAAVAKSLVAAARREVSKQTRATKSLLGVPDDRIADALARADRSV